MKQIEECHQILKDPNGYVKRFKAESGRKVVGTFCSYAPEEIILAAGAHPFRLFGSGEKIRLAEAHLQSYCCSLVRGALEDALGGRLEFLDGVVFPHTCDSIQRLSDIWRLNVPACFHLDVVLPVKLDTDGARQYLIDVLKRFREDLGEKLGVTISDDDLRAAIRTMNRIRAALTRIYDLKGERPEILKGSDLYALVRAAMIMDRTRAASLLEEVAAELEKKSASEVAAWPKKRIVLSGGVCNHPDIYTIIEEAGGAVVGDDLCTGSRYFSGLIDEKADPVDGHRRAVPGAGRLPGEAPGPDRPGGPPRPSGPGEAGAGGDLLPAEVLRSPRLRLPLSEGGPGSGGDSQPAPGGRGPAPGRRTAPDAVRGVCRDDLRVKSDHAALRSTNRWFRMHPAPRECRKIFERE